ncbi:MAG TPA: M23 family metallopeptidase [Flavobacteriales bacterium]
MLTLRTSLFLFLVICCGALRAQDHGHDHMYADEDTLSAVVFYGDDKLLDTDEALTDEMIEALLDSLCTLDVPPADLIEDLRLFRKIRGMGGDELTTLIDSLFELPEVPYALINEINLFADQLPQQVDVDRSPVVAWSTTTLEPGFELYGNWNSAVPNPYGPELSANDTLLRLRLTNDDLGHGFHTPVPPVVTSRFGWRNGRNHNGIDLDLEVWDTVRSVFPGVVRYASTCGGFGRLVVVRHFNGLETYYAHLHRLKVQPGDVVNAGDLVGLGGSSGHSTGSHLHFEVRFKGLAFDPSHVIDFSTGQLYCDTLVLKRTKWTYAAYPEGTHFHTVERGEHLVAIAELYGTSTNVICSLNGLKPTSPLRPGQRLLVTSDPSERYASAGSSSRGLGH